MQPLDTMSLSPPDRGPPALPAALGPTALALAVIPTALSKDESGAISIIFALLLLPMLGAVGLAVDYQRLSTARQFMQSQVDAAALGGAGAGPEGDPARWLERARRATELKFPGSGWVDSIVVDGAWRSPNEFAAEAQAAIDLTFLRILPGVPDNVDVVVRAVAQLALPTLVYEEPLLAQLDPEAADYNRLSAYCFDPRAVAEGKSDGRSQLTVIADNAGTAYNFTMPRCAAGEVMSYRLWNVRDARTKPKLWDDPLRENYVYNTDTVLEDGVEAYDLDWAILETVLCDTLDDCKPQAQGGDIPEGENRVPERATGACTAGKFMYYGWEDRPPGRGWTDRDYDDIRVIVACPVIELDGDKRIRLIS